MSVPPPSKEISAVSYEHLERLICKAQSNKDLYFDELYRYLWPHLYYVVFALVKNDQDTQDLMQQTFLSIFNKLDTIRDPRAGFAWANTIAVNNARTHMKKANSKVVVEDSYEELSVDPAADSSRVPFSEELRETQGATQPETRLEGRERSKLIFDLISDLPTNLREILLLYYYQELSTKEIAAVLNVTLSTVTTRLHRARLRIKRDIKNSSEELRFYTATLGIRAALKTHAGTTIPAPPPWRSTPTPANNPKTKGPNSRQWLAIGASATAALLVAGIATYALLKPTLTSQPQDSPAIARPDAQSPKPDKSPASAPTSVIARPDAQSPKPDKSPASASETPTAPSPSGSGPSSAAPAAKPKSTPKPKKSPASASTPVDVLAKPAKSARPDAQSPKPDKSPASAPNTSPTAQPEDTPSLPFVNSLLRFGTLSGTPITWRVSARNGTILTATATGTITSLDGAFTSAEQAAITKIIDGAKPTITIDGSKLNFTFKGSYCYAEAK